MTENFFNLLNIPQAFVVDLNKLDQHYQAIQKEIHPDRFASLSEAEKITSVKKTALVNDAYQTVKHPIRRAEYLLHLHGINISDEKLSAVPQDFLLEQMEWREDLESHRSDKVMLDKLALSVQHQKDEMINALPLLFNETDMNPDAIIVTRKLNFIEKFEQHLHDALIEIN